MKEYEVTGHTTRESSEQRETGTSSSWASKFLGLPSKMGGWVRGKKANEESINSPSASPSSSVVVTSSSSAPYEMSEDEEDDDRSYLDLINDNEVGGLANELNMKYGINEYQGGDSKKNHDQNVDKEKEDNQEEEGEQIKNQIADHSDSVSTDSFASASSPPVENGNMDFTLVEIKQEPLDDDEVAEVDKNGVKVKVVKFPVLELAELFRYKKELEALKCVNKREKEEKPATLQQVSHDAPVEPDVTTVSASTSRRNPRRSAKKPKKKKNGKTEKNGKTKKSKKISGIKERKKPSKKKPKNVVELSCPECERTFTTKSGLRNHELSHKRSTGQFKCSVCGKDQFKTAHHLRQHEACHSLSEMCGYCEKKFGSRSNLANHQRTSKICKAIRQNGAAQ